MPDGQFNQVDAVSFLGMLQGAGQLAGQQESVLSRLPFLAAFPLLQTWDHADLGGMARDVKRFPFDPVMLLVALGGDALPVRDVPQGQIPTDAQNFRRLSYLATEVLSEADVAEARERIAHYRKLASPDFERCAEQGIEGLQRSAGVLMLPASYMDSVGGMLSAVAHQLQPYVGGQDSGYDLLEQAARAAREHVSVFMNQLPPQNLSGLGRAPVHISTDMF